MRLGKFTNSVLAAGWLVLASLSPVPAQEVRLTLAHDASERSMAHSLLLKPWAQRLTIASAGRLKVAVEAGGKTDGSGLYQRLTAGEVDLVWAPLAELPGEFPEMAVFELPFLAWPAEATSQAALTFHRKHDAEIGSEVKALFFHADAPAWLHMAREPARRAQDLQGRRIYAPTRALRDLLRGLGAEPVALDDPAAAEPMLAGREIDGAVLSFAAAGPAGIVEATRFHTQFGRPAEAARPRRPGLGTTVYVLAMNAARYRALPEDLRSLLAKTADRALAEHTGRTWDSVDRLARRNARTEGHVFYKLTDAELNAWRRAAQPVIDSWLAEAGAEGRDGAALLREARTLIARFHVLMAKESEARTRPGLGKGG